LVKEVLPSRVFRKVTVQILIRSFLYRALSLGIGETQISNKARNLFVN
jgi:hypothetical protein